MFRLSIVVILVALMTVFAINNMHHVNLIIILGTPVNVRLFYLLLSSFLIGCSTAVLTRLYLITKFRKRKKPAQDADGDDFFSV